MIANPRSPTPDHLHGQHRRSTILAAMFCCLWLLGGCDRAPTDATPPQATNALPATAAPAGEAQRTAAPRELDWDDLIPPQWQPERLMNEYQADELEDDDPRAKELMDKLRVLWDQAPVVPELDGAAIRLPGFVVPLETLDEEVTEFLLVPYYGACVHVPPPPANQTIYVLPEQGKAGRWALFDTVWVSGTLQARHTSSDAGEAGYTLYASEVEPYDEQ